MRVDSSKKLHRPQLTEESVLPVVRNHDAHWAFGGAPDISVKNALQ